MRRKRFVVTVAFAVFATSFGCSGRRTEDRVDQGAQGPTSPVESGQHRDKAKMDAEHETAGLNGEMSNGKVDVTMEGSGNLAWQGSYEREKRARQQSRPETQPAPQKPLAR